MRRQKDSRFGHRAHGFHAMGALCAGLLFIAGTSKSLRAQAVPADAPYKNTSLPFAERVKDLVSRMTLQEKAQEMRSAAPGISRLGIPAVNWWTEGIHGISRAGTATVFPQAMAMAAAWDPPLMQKVGDAIADEARAKYNPGGVQYQGIIVWSPTINMARDPRWGRTEETYGEDPYLTGRLAVSFIKGLQGDDPKYLKTVATPKHFAMHSQESGRQNRSFDCPEPILRDYYFPAFHDAIVEGKATSIMAAFKRGSTRFPIRQTFSCSTRCCGKSGASTGSGGDGLGCRLVAGERASLCGARRSGEGDSAAAVNAGIDVISDQRDVTPNIVNAVTENMLSGGGAGPGHCRGISCVCVSGWGCLISASMVAHTRTAVIGGGVEGVHVALHG